jgi:hypothetical protein
VEEQSNRTLRITHFSYDGEGPPGVVIMLHKTLGAERSGTIISPDLFGQGFEAADTRPSRRWPWRYVCSPR